MDETTTCFPLGRERRTSTRVLARKKRSYGVGFDLPTLQPGMLIDGRYRLSESIGAGGMSIVYKAVDEDYADEVAIKFLLQVTDPERMRFFQREVQMVSALSHPNIVQFFDAGMHCVIPYFCMELVSGKTLGERLRDEFPMGFPLSQVFRVGLSFLEALHYAHQQRLIHRDIKPGNIMLTEKGDIKIMDFGVARAFCPDAFSTIVGTPAYMAPEQIEGLRVDHRSDIFSVGVMFYELLCGVRPFQGIVRGTPVPIQDRCVVPMGLARVIMSCLALSPDERPGDIPTMMMLIRLVKRSLGL